MTITITYTKDGKDINEYYPFIKITYFDEEIIEGEINEDDIFLLKPYVKFTHECCSIFDEDGELLFTETSLR